MASPLGQLIWGSTLWVTANVIILQINTLIPRMTLFDPSQFPDFGDTFLFRIELLNASFFFIFTQYSSFSCYFRVTTRTTFTSTYWAVLASDTVPFLAPVIQRHGELCWTTMSPGGVLAPWKRDCAQIMFCVIGHEDRRSPCEGWREISQGRMTWQDNGIYTIDIYVYHIFLNSDAIWHSAVSDIMWEQWLHV